ncbi:Helix-turn-helix domain-containing protein [Polaromonas sp. OV174]|uniref:helix-turn-helix transcriptional regulator n=1 Tax=Polaromonas sp. OV174 TaxID=1855300 RepID=UPI0008F3924A|nr:helix-turn-helix domain-containing protein [Polaromonas sp. OV174]SFC11051.1 Helix-turn-helix domain-containing protein [Polaromonas sp. OV174]
MSTYEHDYSGLPRRFKSRTPSEVLAARPKANPFLVHLLDGGQTLRCLVEDGVQHQYFFMILAASLACGIDFGIYRSTGPRKVFLMLGSTYFAHDVHRLDAVKRMPIFAEASALLERNLSIYAWDHEKDPRVDLGHSITQEAMRNSMPSDIEVVMADWVPSFIRPKMAKLKPISPYPWFHELNADGIAVVAGDILLPADRRSASEAISASTAYLTVDPNAPSQFGGGLQIERWRVGDADYAPRRSSFWHTEIGAELDYGFALDDPDDTDKPSLIRKTEREIKVEVMLAQGMPQKDIAKILGVHKSTITRMKQHLDEEAAKAEKAEARDPNASRNRWDNVVQLGKHLMNGSKESEGEEGEEKPVPV